jgi:hypothetical protein
MQTQFDGEYFRAKAAAYFQTKKYFSIGRETKIYFLSSPKSAMEF